MKWNPTLYDKKHDFVAEYGKGLLEFIPCGDGQAILDLGCGTGTLTAQLRDLGGRVLGVDSSEHMIAKAKEQFPQLEFQVCDALALPFRQEWDVVFSNAVFHWISDHHTLLQNIHQALKPGGTLVCEFGTGGNIAVIERSFAQVCEKLGYAYRSKFNFPTPEAFGQLLTQHGFLIDRLYDFDRPTPLKDGEQGLANWLRQFFASELAAMPADTQTAALEMMEQAARPSLWNGTAWVVDYRRLRAVAHTEHQ